MAGRPPLEVVLHEPEIPNNTGNIGRTCVATGCALHLIRPMGFDTDEKACRRAGLDYWPRLRVREHDDWAAFVRWADAASSPGAARVWMLSTKGGRSYFDADLRRGDFVVFGKETAGLPPALLAAAPERVLSMPMAVGERSLNVATAACAVVYEGLRQMLARGELALDAAGRLGLDR